VLSATRSPPGMALRAALVPRRIRYVNVTRRPPQTRSIWWSTSPKKAAQWMRVGSACSLIAWPQSQFSNGAFVVKHRGVFQTYDWGHAIREQAEPTRIHWAALFGDVDHQIERVWGGLRVTLSYLIRRGTNAARSAMPGGDLVALNTLVRQKLRDLLDDRRFLAEGGTLAFPCAHLYHQDAGFQRKQRPLPRQ